VLWTLIAGGMLGAIRFLHSIDEDFIHQVADLATFFAVSTALVLGSTVVVFARRWPLKWLALMFAAALLVGALGGARETYQYLERRQASANGTMPWTVLLMVGAGQMLQH